NVDAKAFVLMDANTGKILASQNENEHRAPASLTKIMTLYVVADALKSGRIHMNDQVLVSEKAWRAKGSRMFIKVGQTVPLSDLIQGAAVASGNDACIALAEHVAGSEESFAALMNQEAQALGMTNTHFADSNGLPAENHYSSAHDLAILAKAFVHNFPEEYKWFQQKWFTYNNIKQPNRNRLLWQNPVVDGMKTGFTDDAGFCLVASGQQNGMRLISVIMGADSEKVRRAETQRLLTYGFRFFESPKLYQANQKLADPRVWLGQSKTTPIGASDNVYVTIPNGDYKNLKITLELNKQLEAPITKGQKIGNLHITLKDKSLTDIPLIALADNPRGGLWSRMSDRVKLTLKRWLGQDESPIQKT
ncbi:MAG: D-alanyl-D-alanine carboxypeptidase, partial [Proteobacteria bacterium]|nr:D-alanyl-D-alanine carboxypeptidase [Pseudomonadota bacterium]